jgi:hypothetical protein
MHGSSVQVISKGWHGKGSQPFASSGAVEKTTVPIVTRNVRAKIDPKTAIRFIIILLV